MNEQYLNLFRKLYPQFEFQINKGKVVAYVIDFISVDVSDNVVNIKVKSNRIVSESSVDIGDLVLYSVLTEEIRDISRYINLEDKLILVKGE